MKFGQEGDPIFLSIPAKFREKIRSGGPKKNLCWLAKKYIILCQEGKSAYSSLGGGSLLGAMHPPSPLALMLVFP